MCRDETTLHPNVDHSVKCPGFASAANACIPACQSWGPGWGGPLGCAGRTTPPPGCSSGARRCTPEAHRGTYDQDSAQNILRDESKREQRTEMLQHGAARHTGRMETQSTPRDSNISSVFSLPCRKSGVSDSAAREADIVPHANPLLRQGSSS